ncbi:hypothetical protein TL16_g06072 [Triparma laevis f. inornata]|uniref:tRNA (guanine(26)-N(2))-dimethyltransferase n=1 Tax=Triparma laevis f. inornata TaxID=1714386 RepID=A0A9W7EBW2_9STRA|nr:hypothetical protein TL16_g06072 [Triparma laevis f. inornata]
MSDKAAGNGDADTVTITENSSTMHFPNKNEVFYNKVQVLNRDLSITMIRLHGERMLKERREKAEKKKLRKIFYDNPEKFELTDKKKKKSKGPEPDFLSQAKENLKDVDWTNEVRSEDAARKLHRSAVLNNTPSASLPPSPPPGLKIMDCLAASGLRSMRYYHEIQNLDLVTINDLETPAITLAENNIKQNSVDPTVVRTRVGDGTMLCYESRNGVESIRPDPRNNPICHPSFPLTGRYDVIDLDPYGSAAPFIDGAVQSVVDGGMLNVTCTDMAVLSGNHPETCFAKYRSMPIHKGRYLHELALRILLQSLESQANKYGRHIVPIASFGIDFYIRVFVRVFDSKAEVKKSSLKIGYVYQSTGCPSFHVVPSGTFTGKSYVPQVIKSDLVGVDGKCAETGKPFKVGGPFWTAPIHDLEVVDKAVKRVENPRDYGQNHDPLPTSKRLHGLLTTVSEELSDCPLYYLLPDLASTCRAQVPPRGAFLAQLEELGYRVSATHKEADAIKTDAPNDVVWDLMRNWVRLNPVAAKRERKDESKPNKGETAGMLILEKEPKFFCDFKTKKNQKLLNRKKATRYPQNPEANWGPKARANVTATMANVEEVSKRKIAEAGLTEEKDAKKQA